MSGSSTLSPLELDPFSAFHRHRPRHLASLFRFLRVLLARVPPSFSLPSSSAWSTASYSLSSLVVVVIVSQTLVLTSACSWSLTFLLGRGQSSSSGRRCIRRDVLVVRSPSALSVGRWCPRPHQDGAAGQKKERGVPRNFVPSTSSRKEMAPQAEKKKG